jgi:hypothetical protein
MDVEDAHVPAYLHLQGHLLQPATLHGPDAWTTGTPRRTGDPVPREQVMPEGILGKAHVSNLISGYLLQNLLNVFRKKLVLSV